MKNLILLIFILFASQIQAQVSTVKPPAFYQNPNTTDFKTIQRDSESWWDGKDKGKGSGYKQWKRWEARFENKLSPEGQITNYAARNFDALQQWESTNINSRSAGTNWMPWGENNYEPDEEEGTGVLNCIAFHPTDPNIIYTGGPTTGLWVTYNHGNTWSNLTDNYMITGISSIIIDHTVPSTIYILTGDGDGGDSFSQGVWKTTNGGGTWSPTALSWDQDELVRGYKLAMSPTDRNVILAATGNGLYRTEDGGTDWNREDVDLFYDVVFKPGSGTVAYASTESEVYKSTNSGESWSQVLEYDNDCERVQIAVSADEPNWIYALGGGFHLNNAMLGFKGCYRSTNSGTDWSLQSNTPAICSYGFNGTGSTFSIADQVPYDIDFDVNPNNAGILYMGAINTSRSLNNGLSWTLMTHWASNYTGAPQYMHADVHAVEYHPINGDLYIANDGGIYHSSNNGTTWTDLTPGMQINQFFDFDGTPQNSEYMIGGLYHNGSREFTGGAIAPSIGGGDGTGCAIDPFDMNTLYRSSQAGSLSKSTNGGMNFTPIRPDTLNSTFVTNIEVSPVNSNRIYTGWSSNKLYYSDNKGTSWSSVLVPGSGSSIRDINAATDGTTVYAVTFERAVMSTDNALTWTTIRSLGSGFNYIVSNPIDPSLAVFTRGGFNAGDKIYLSVNGNDTNISYNLPNVPANCAAWSIENGITYIYVGTDIGIFKKILGGNTWEKCDDGLPKGLDVQDLYVYYNGNGSTKKIRAATFGRGIWEANFQCPSVLNLTESNDPNNGKPVFELNEASSVITNSRKVIGTSGEVIYKATNLVVLQSGFLATEGNKVLIGNKECGASLE